MSFAFMDLCFCCCLVELLFSVCVSCTGYLSGAGVSYRLEENGKHYLMMSWKRFRLGFFDACKQISAYNEALN